MQKRPVIAVISISRSEQCGISELKYRLRSHATVQDVETADDAIAALATNPSAVVITDDALKQASLDRLRSEALRYVQNGGNVLFTCAPTHEVYPLDFASVFFGSDKIGYIDATDVARSGEDMIESVCGIRPDTPLQ